MAVAQYFFKGVPSSEIPLSISSSLWQNFKRIAGYPFCPGKKAALQVNDIAVLNDLETLSSLTY